MMCLLVLILAMPGGIHVCSIDMPTDDMIGYDIKQIITSSWSLPRVAAR